MAETESIAEMLDHDTDRNTLREALKLRRSLNDMTPAEKSMTWATKRQIVLAHRTEESPVFLLPIEILVTFIFPSLNCFNCHIAMECAKYRDPDMKEDILRRIKLK
jgi:hypothetical protein